LDCKPLQLSPLEVNTDSVMTMEIPAILLKRISALTQFKKHYPLSMMAAWTFMQVVLVRSEWPELTQHGAVLRSADFLVIEMTQLLRGMEYTVSSKPSRVCQI